MAAVAFAAIVAWVLPIRAENNCGIVAKVRKVAQYAMLFAGIFMDGLAGARMRFLRR